MHSYIYAEPGITLGSWNSAVEYVVKQGCVGLQLHNALQCTLEAICCTKILPTVFL